MSDIIDHLKTAIKFLDPENNLVNIGRARSEIRDALCEYYIEKEVSDASIGDQCKICQEN